MSKRSIKKEMKKIQEKLDIIEDLAEQEELMDKLDELDEQLGTQVMSKTKKWIAIIGSIAGLVSTIIGIIIVLL